MGRFVFWSSLTLGCLALAGCGPDGPQRHEITGTVLFKGKPLDEGIITFIPADGQGSQDGAQILNGEYRIPKEKGLFPGKYKVVIIGGDGRSSGGQADPGGTGDAPPKGARFVPGKERIPPEYNEKTTQVREVTSRGPNRFDFDIK